MSLLLLNRWLCSHRADRGSIWFRTTLEASCDLTFLHLFALGQNSFLLFLLLSPLPLHSCLRKTLKQLKRVWTIFRLLLIMLLASCLLSKLEMAFRKHVRLLRGFVVHFRKEVVEVALLYLAFRQSHRSRDVRCLGDTAHLFHLGDEVIRHGGWLVII